MSEIPQTCDTAGIEIEAELASSGNFSSRNRNFTATSDASVQSSVPHFQGVPVSKNEFFPHLRFRNSGVGFEVVSSILDITDPEYIRDIKWITNELRNMGELDQSYRAGIHYHISFTNNLKICKNVLRLGRHLEQVFFALAGMGYDFRGPQNDCIYFRPITKYGPLVVPTGWSYYAQCFNIKDLLGTKNMKEFLVKYGYMSHLRNERYVPVRYHWLNLKPLFEQGSLEFRIFNKTLNPYYIWATMEFCRYFCKFVLGSTFSSLKQEKLLKENSIYDVEDTNKILRVFWKFCNIAGVDQEVAQICEEIILKTPIESLKIEPVFVYCHLQFHRRGSRVQTHWREGEYKPEKITTNKIKEPTFFDSHVLAEMRPNDSPSILPPSMINWMRQPRPPELERGRAERISPEQSLFNAELNFNSTTWTTFPSNPRLEDLIIDTGVDSDSEIFGRESIDLNDFENPNLALEYIASRFDIPDINGDVSGNLRHVIRGLGMNYSDRLNERFDIEVNFMAGVFYDYLRDETDIHWEEDEEYWEEEETSWEDLFERNRERATNNVWFTLANFQDWYNTRR